MFDLDGEWTSLALVWLAFMTVVGVYVIRIALMLHAQRAVERAYRVRLALRLGRAVREMAERGPVPTVPGPRS